MLTTRAVPTDVGTSATRRETSEQRGSEEPTPKLHIAQDGSYFAELKGAWYEAELSYLGTPIIGARLDNAPEQLDPSPPAKWGDG